MDEDTGSSRWAGRTVRTDGDGRTVVRLRGPDDVLGIVPWRLGFHPTESLVVVVLQGSRRRERLVMRMDLPDPRSGATAVAVARETAGRAEQAAADEVLVAIYTTAADDAGELPFTDLVDELASALDDVGVDLPEALLVRDGRRWSYLCREPSCCPPDGLPLPERPTAAADAYAAEAVLRGAVVLPDRGALRRSVHPSDHAVAVAVRRRAWDQLATLVPTGRMAAEGAERLGLLRERFARGEREPPEPVDALLVALGLVDPRRRDGLMTAVLDDDTGAVLELLGHVARLVDDDVAAPVCTVLGWLAYATGDGALALVAVERALRADPGYTMAQLLLGGIDGMVPPSALRDVSRAVRSDLAADGPVGRESTASGATGPARTSARRRRPGSRRSPPDPSGPA